MSEQQGLVRVQSRYSLKETIDRLRATLCETGLQIFALIDHSGEAEKAGLKMRPTKLIIFGSPKAGTPLMVAAPTLAIDLPLKALIAEDASGKVSVTYNSPEYLQQRHGFPAELMNHIRGAGVLIAKTVE